jgi:nucleotide-binding universal stress UspA family protein
LSPLRLVAAQRRLEEPFEHEELVAGGQTHRQILRLACERDVDLIVLGVHGRRGIDHILPGGTLCHVVRGASCPVLVVGSPPAAERARQVVDQQEAWL